MPKVSLILADPKTGTSKAFEVEGAKLQTLVGRSIGDVMDGNFLGIQGKLVITGGSDVNGVPMRADIHGGGVRRVLMSTGLGFHPAKEGERRRKLIRGRMISSDIVQVNCALQKEAA